MLRYALLALIIALIAGAFGFTQTEGVAVQIARVLFVVFLIVFVASLILGNRSNREIV